MEYISGHKFYLQTIGKKIDVDGAYGNQCVDLWNHYNRVVNDGAYINCKPSGYAHSLWDNRANNGALKYYDEVPLNALQDGDWCIFGKNNQTPSSHVAMFRIDNGNGTAVFLGQNQGGRLDAVDQRNFRLNGLIGAFRSKGAPKQASVEYLNLDASVPLRTIYNLAINKKVASINPGKFGGLSYKVQKRLNDRYVQIKTGFGDVAICVDPTAVGGGFSISNTRKYKNGD